jgi:hypothetical protein
VNPKLVKKESLKGSSNYSTKSRKTIDEIKNHKIIKE